MIDTRAELMVSLDALFNTGGISFPDIEPLLIVGQAIRGLESEEVDFHTCKVKITALSRAAQLKLKEVESIYNTAILDYERKGQTMSSATFEKRSYEYQHYACQILIELRSFLDEEIEKDIIKQ